MTQQPSAIADTISDGGGIAQKITPGQQMISSCTGAILTSLLVTPLDVVKIRLQAQKQPFHKGDCFLYRNGLMDHLFYCSNGNGSKNCTHRQWYRKPGHFSGTMDAFIKIARTEGVPSLWSGLPPTLIMAVPATVIYFTSYEQFKVCLRYREQRTEWWKPMAAGATARVFAASVISPLELIRTKIQSEQMSYKQVRHAMLTSIRHEGVRSLWRGLGPTVLRDVPFSALYWFGYEELKTDIRRKTGATQLSFIQNFVAGGISGAVAATVTVPFDVIKTHRQIELGRAKGGTVEVTSTWHLMMRLYRHHGVTALFSGLGPRVLKIAPACAIMISTYEYFKSFFRSINQRDIQSTQTTNSLLSS